MNGIMTKNTNPNKKESCQIGSELDLAGVQLYRHEQKEMLQITINIDKSSNEVAALAVVGPLVLQPLSVSLYATNLLAVVIGNGVGNRVGRGVNTEPTNAVEELFLFLQIAHITLVTLP